MELTLFRRDFRQVMDGSGDDHFDGILDAAIRARELPEPYDRKDVDDITLRIESISYDD